MFPPIGILAESHFMPMLFNDIWSEVITPGIGLAGSVKSGVPAKSTVIPLFANFS